jgi:predicted nucleotidyltransferase
MSVQQLEQRFPEILTNYPGVGLVYLFGSRAAGNAGPASDYDLGVVVDRDERGQIQHADQIRVRLANDLAVALCTDRIDVVVLNDAPIELQRAVIAQGRLVHERDVATRVEYEAHVMSVYGDYLPVLRAQREEILRGGERGLQVRRYRKALARTRRALGEILAKEPDDDSCTST